MHCGDDEGHGRRGAGPGHDLKYGGDIAGGARRAEGVVEEGGVGDEAEGTHVPQHCEGGREEASMGGDAEEEGVMRQGKGLWGGGGEEGHGGWKLGERGGQ
uniref:Uncharacterized protein n=1 Tax=Arundo donax TaxID=35708 RepID=A0A0A9H047_ARUDO